MSRAICSLAALSFLMCAASNDLPVTGDNHFVSFPDRETPTWVATLTSNLVRQSAGSGGGDWRGERPIPAQVFASFRALSIERQLEFATYRVNAERPSARRWARAMVPLAHPSVENALAEMLEADKSYSFRVSILSVAWFLGNDGDLTCDERLKRDLLITAKREDRIFFDDTLPKLLRLMHCGDDHNANP